MTIAHAIDTLIEARWIIPVEPAETVLTDHSIAIANGRIVAILPTAEARLQFVATHYLKLPDHALIPGLINLHTHAAMNLLRGYADDRPLMEWLKGHIWPAETRHVSPEFVRDGARLACAEMLKGGITCFNDMYFFPEAVAEAAVSCGMRAAIGMLVIDFPTAYASDPDDYLDKGLAMRDRLNDEPLLSFTLAPHAPYTLSNASFEKVIAFADQLDLPIHLHLHETLDEIEHSLAQYRQRPLARLHELGLTGPNLIAVHAVHLNADEQALLAQYGSHIAHCPASNLKLASGFAPIASMLEYGLNIGIGTDGAASNNKLDMFDEMRLAALLSKGVSGNAAALPAAVALQMATLNGARALGLDEKIGSLLPGKYADIVAVELSQLNTLPCFDPISTLVYSAGRNLVSHVWVNGELLVDDRQFSRLDERALKINAHIWQNRIRPSLPHQ
ncbi:MAG: TRZ/ATZ family hydrolase [Burkholderiales bacterium]